MGTVLQRLHATPDKGGHQLNPRELIGDSQGLDLGHQHGDLGFFSFRQPALAPGEFSDGGVGDKFWEPVPLVRSLLVLDVEPFLPPEGNGLDHVQVEVSESSNAGEPVTSDDIGRVALEVEQVLP